MKNPTLLLLAALLMALVGVAAVYNGGGTLTYNVAGFGTEYGNTAASLVGGQGYSNPFGFSTGPSSWVPPVIVVVYAIIFAIFGVKTYSAGLALLLVRAFSLTFAAWLLLKAAQTVDGETTRGSFFILPLTALAYFGHYHWLSQRCTDQWLIILFTSMSVLCLAQIWRNKNHGWHYLLCVLLPLTAPAVALGFGLILVVEIVRRKRQALLLFFAFLLPICVWTARNYVVMGVPFPIKSNLGFEFFLSNQCSPSGLLTSEAHLAHHPLHPTNTTSEEIRQVGESKFCVRYRTLAAQHVRQQPQNYFGKVLKRWNNAFLYTRLSGSPGIVVRFRGLIYALLPFVTLLIGFARGGRRLRCFQHVALLYLAYFLPYVLVSHGERYQLGALGLQIWLVWVVLFSNAWAPGESSEE